MADEPVSGAPAPVTSAPAASPAPAPAPAPAASAPAPASAADSTPAPAPAPASAAGAPSEPPKPADAAPDPVKALLASDEPTLLETIGEKPVEKAPEPNLKPDSAENPQKLPEKFVFSEFKAPEGVQLDTTRITALDDVMNERLPPQEQRDKLLNMHIDEMRNYDAKLRQQQQDAFRDTRKGWLQQIKADPELGGSGFDTTKLNVAEMRDLFASHHDAKSPEYIEDMAEFNHMLRYTGVGDHPAFWRFLNNVARKFKEPAAPAMGDFRPPPDLGKPVGRGGRRSSMYDHPTSHNNRGTR